MKQTLLLPPVREALTQFPHVFSGDATYNSALGAAWAPGRVNIIGEHTDYNGGFVLPLAVDRVVAFAGRARNAKAVRLWSSHFKEQVEFSLDGLPDTFDQQRGALPSWARYILGVVTGLLRAGAALNGFDAIVTGDVPPGGGMSSSAALEVAAAHACALFSGGQLTMGQGLSWVGILGKETPPVGTGVSSPITHVLHRKTPVRARPSRPSGHGDNLAPKSLPMKEGEATLSPMQVAALCQRAEQMASGVRCGILDQAASCLGRPHKAILLDCRSLAYRYLPFDAPEVSIVVIDTGVRRELAASAYNERRQQCEDAVKLTRQLLLKDNPDDAQIQEIQALRDVTPAQFTQVKKRLPEVLQRRAGYVIAENERVLQVADLLEQSRIEEAGAILWPGHAGLRDEYEVSCAELDTLVEIARRVPGVLGARMMGGGFGGCTINLVRNDAVETLRRLAEQEYPRRCGRVASVDVCCVAGGPGYGFIE